VQKEQTKATREEDLLCVLPLVLEAKQVLKQA